MSKIYTIAILGCGNRGGVYANFMNKLPDKFKVVALCDTRVDRLEHLRKTISITPDNLFTDENEFLKEKRADVLIIATWDKDHVRQCLRAMELGYDILLEKPISDSAEEVKALLDMQNKTNCKIAVCHVLRYAPAFKLLDEIIKSGKLGKLMAIDHTERVTYWHFIQAYIKMHSSWQGKLHPTILAKCCHDLDLIQHYAGSKCKNVSSVGDRSCFTKENAPKGATEFCLDCPHVETCPYSAKKIYVEKWIKSGRPDYAWPYYRVTAQNPITEEALYEGLRTNVFGKCPYFIDLDNDPHVVDHQLVQMLFKNGVVANLKLIFSATKGRRVVLYGEFAEVVLDELIGTVEFCPHGEEKTTYKISDLTDTNQGHGGGDKGIVNDFYKVLTGECTDFTSLEESLESHLIGIAAEESRLNGNKTITIH